MAPKYFGTLLAPPCRAVLLTEAALGMKLEHQEINYLEQDHLTPEFLKLNPQHTIPILVDDDGTKVSDSHAIMAYLVGKYGKDDKLCLKDHARRADVDHELHFDTGLVFSTLRKIILNMRFNGARGADDSDKRLTEENYGFLNTFLEGRTWVSGDSITIADFSLLSSVTSYEAVVPIDPKFTNIHNWIKRAEALPYYNINQEGLVKMHELVRSLSV